MDWGCCGKIETAQFWLYFMNKPISWFPLWIYGYIFFIGALAKIWPKPLPEWIITQMVDRKAVSYVAAFFLMYHVLISCLTTTPAYHGKAFGDDGRMHGTFEFSFTMGILAFIILMAVSMTSIYNSHYFLQKYF